MSDFYRKTAVVFSTLFLFSAIVAVICIKQSYLEVLLFPAQNSDLKWFASAHSDSQTNGESTVVLHEKEERLSYSFMLSPAAPAPYAGVSLALGSLEPFKPSIDLSMYSTLTFNAACDTASTLTVTVNTLDSSITVPDDPLSYRPAVAHFSCKAGGSNADIDLRRLEVPSWWLRAQQIDLANRQYFLAKASHMNFGISSQTPMHQTTQVIIERLRLQGRAWAWVFSLIAVLVVIWAGFIFWWLKFYTQSMIEMLSEKSKNDEQLYVKRELKLESQGDKNKNAVLAYMSEQYTNPELNVELAVSALGINRSKMNAILKEVVGLTFSAYLNKLRLIEAARLLAESESINVAEIAYSVGYNNVSYFNKLFKDEYSCTPKVYKSLLQSESA
ncbi:helix-turn-helix domain-containing protein [Marinagarivorans cellulosilyticus]|uniref:HTH araC/xylS-type domain-containing protein n=1 Tax=Marinagarivorans cellulosilyticus TaxID=2721545 RepID=A0AAN1WJB0_9GAMM|nr:helix-turn-helix domain-containing protein [Marinagarivorans cellulosilyticus]BCD98634.1 hypothetical protein MARGE09_P2835 [Marinagarivorans cellulosilyticus]